MRFKISVPKDPKHCEPVNCVGWTNADEVYSIGDDHIIYKSNLINNEVQKVTELPNDLYPTDMHWYPKAAGAGRKTVPDIFVLGSSEGKFYLMSKGGKIEKAIDAHKGAVIACRWSYDGTMIASGGEDGQVKLWSKTGMIRSTLSQSNGPIYSLVWSVDNENVLFTCGKYLTIKPLSVNSKSNTWKAHEGVILKCDWNPVNGLIISGGEDCRYKVWDPYGRQLFASAPHEYPITCLAWAPDGELFSVSSYNTLRLCDKSGWSYSLEKSNIGSAFAMSWSSDSTQLVCGCGTGHVIVSNVIEKRLEWRHYEFLVTDTKHVKVRNCENDTKEDLDFKDRVIKMSAGFGYLIIITPTQCYIYSIKNFNTPSISELKEGSVTLILQAERYYSLVDGAGLYVYSYDGRLVSSPKWNGMRTELLNVNTITMSNDFLAVTDSADHKSVMIFETNGKPLFDGKPITHTVEISEISLDQSGNTSDRKLAFVDKNRDLYIINVRTPGNSRRTYKIGTNIHNFVWNDTYNMLAGISDGRFTVWYYPSVAYVDKNLLQKTIFQKDANEYGRNVSITGFLGNHVTMRGSDGSAIHAGISPYATVLHSFLAANKWEDALKLCRFVKETYLWSMLAGASVFNKDLETALIAYAALNEIDKVEYINSIKELPNKEIRNAETALFCGNVQEAESIYLQNNLIFRAVMLNINQYNWTRALELAAKYETHIDTVVGFRQKYLDLYDKAEKNHLFLKYRKDVDVEMDKILKNVENEYLLEKQGKPSTHKKA